MDNETRPMPEEGRQPYPACRGKEAYIFVSYAHQDSEKVFAEIKRFGEAGFHVWYDGGIAPGNEWSDEIAAALSGFSVFVVMLTPASASSENVMDEISFALDEGKHFLAIYLEETSLPPGLKLRTARKQALVKYTLSDEEYEQKYLEAFTRMGLGNSASEKQENVSEKTDPPPQSLIPQDSGTEGKKLSFFRKLIRNKTVEIDGFQILAGLMTGYTGTHRDLVLPSAVRAVGAFSFKNCRDFMESVDLGNVKLIQMNTFLTVPISAASEYPAGQPGGSRALPSKTVRTLHSMSAKASWLPASRAASAARRSSIYRNESSPAPLPVSFCHTSGRKTPFPKHVILYADKCTAFICIF